MCRAPHLFLWRLLTIKTVFKIVTRNCQLKIVFNDKIVSTSFTLTSADNLLKHRHSDQLGKVLSDWPIVTDFFLGHSSPSTLFKVLSQKVSCVIYIFPLLHTFHSVDSQGIVLTAVDWWWHCWLLLTGGTVDYVLPALGAAACFALLCSDKADSFTPRCLCGHSHPAYLKQLLV